MASVTAVQSPEVTRAMAQENNSCCLTPVWNFINSIFESISAFFSSLFSSNSSTATHFNERLITAIENAKSNFESTHTSDSICPIIGLTCIKIEISGVSRSFYLHQHARSSNTLGVDAAYENFKTRIVGALPSDTTNYQESSIQVMQYAIIKASTDRFKLYYHAGGEGSSGSGGSSSCTLLILMNRLAGLNEKYKARLAACFDASTGNLVQPTNEAGETLDNPIVLG